jgi:TPR repeat protein
MSSAMNGNRGAGILLGNMYSAGDGVPADKDEADRWYDMAENG